MKEAFAVTTKIVDIEASVREWRALTVVVGALVLGCLAGMWQLVGYTNEAQAEIDRLHFAVEGLMDAQAQTAAAAPNPEDSIDWSEPVPPAPTP